jgi:amino-acid N-acetyltransferase
MNEEIRPVRRDELLPLLDLLEQSGLPIAGVSEHLMNFLVATKSDRIVGMVGLEIYGPVGLLRSLAVEPGDMGAGIGAGLVNAVLEKAAREKLEAVYLLTTTAEGYFPRFGFERISRDEMDSRLAASEELRGACPDTAVCMRVALT